MAPINSLLKSATIIDPKSIFHGKKRDVLVKGTKIHEIKKRITLNEPYIEIVLVSKDSTFIAKKAKMFEEERSVAEKAPVDGIQINDLNIKKEKKISVTEKPFSYSIKVADFYYKDSAKLMVDKIKNEAQIKNLTISRLSKTKYRVLIGPFNDIKSLKNSFEKMNYLNFENLEILNNV